GRTRAGRQHTDQVTSVQLLDVQASMLGPGHGGGAGPLVEADAGRPRRRVVEPLRPALRPDGGRRAREPIPRGLLAVAPGASLFPIEFVQGERGLTAGGPALELGPPLLRRQPEVLADARGDEGLVVALALH